MTWSLPVARDRRYLSERQRAQLLLAAVRAQPGPWFKGRTADSVVHRHAQVTDSELERDSHAFYGGHVVAETTDPLTRDYLVQIPPEVATQLCLEVQELRHRLRWTGNTVTAQMEADRRLGEAVRRALYQEVGTTRQQGKAVDLTLRWWLPSPSVLKAQRMPKPPLFTIMCGAARWTGQTLRDAATAMWREVTTRDPLEEP